MQFNLGRSAKALAGAVAVSALLGGLSTTATAVTSKPNILVIWGDDIGIDNISAYNLGMMGYKTPNIDRIAKEGALFTDAYGEQTCTAGRSAFITGIHPFRSGLLTIGMPGSDQGIPDWCPTIADVMKNHGYMTAQFGKNHLGDQNKHLPTSHGFDEFYGNLYHLNAEEEPETYHYPKDPEFRKKYGPRGVIKSTADGKVEDTGPMTRKRMETADEEFLAAGMDFMERAVKADKPFFMWMNTTRMHVWTRLKPSAVGRTGIGLYPDGMVEHDDHVGMLLDKLDDLGIADNTIIMYSTDNGAEVFTWPDGGNTRFHGEKGTNWEGGHRVPLLVKWPGVIKGGTIINDMMAHNDWMPTFAAAVGDDNIVEEMKQGYEASGKTFKVHLDGYNYLPFFKGEDKKAPRVEYFYFFADGSLNAVRWGDWKVHFAVWEGNLAQGWRKLIGWPMVVHLRADPFEKAPHESEMYIRWYGEQMWLFVPIAAQVKRFLGSLQGFPFEQGGNLNSGSINYQTLKAGQVLKQIEAWQQRGGPEGSRG